MLVAKKVDQMANFAEKSGQRICTILGEKWLKRAKKRAKTVILFTIVNYFECF